MRRGRPQGLCVERGAFERPGEAGRILPGPGHLTLVSDKSALNKSAGLARRSLRGDQNGFSPSSTARFQAEKGATNFP